MLQSRMLAIIAIASAVALGGGILTLAIGLPSSPCAGVIAHTRNFTIIADSTGYNDSAHHQGQWPVMTADRCDTVSITIKNQDTSTHGFAIDYYATRGLEIPGGQSQTFPFVAIRAGQFRVYCTVTCPVHNLMQNGLLSVT